MGQINGDSTIVSVPAVSGGLTPSRIVSGTTGAIKASKGQVYAISAINLNAAVRYLHLYNKATAPTLNTDTALVTIPLPASGAVNVNFSSLGVEFSTGIAWAYTTDDVAVPVTAATSAELHATIFYK